MRDIRGDLQQRAQLCEEQIRAAYAHFENMVQQLHMERDARVADLKTALTMIERLIVFEETLMDNVVTLESPPAQTHALAERLRAANG
jgi:hypothetical protein